MKYLFPILLLILVSSCDRGFEEANIDPVNPTTTTIDRLFAGYLSLCFWKYDYWANHAKNGWMNWMQLVSSPNNRGQSAWQQSDLSRDHLWSMLYTDIFQTYRIIEQLMESQPQEIQEQSQYKLAALKILLFFYTSKVTDLYGDIPFFEAGLGLDPEQPILRPYFDKQEQIYGYMLEELAAIEARFATEDPLQLDFANSENQIDVYFDNDWDKWRRFGNSLRLRLAMRISNIRPALAQQEVAAILGGGLPLIELPEQQAGWDIGLPGYESVGLNDAHRFDEAQGIKTRASQRLWYQLAADLDDASVFDIRAYIFYRKNGIGQWAPIPNSPLAQEQQNISPDPLFDPDAPALYSTISPAFMGGRRTPERHFNCSETAFLRAEAILRGWAPGDAENEYKEGIKRSVEWYVQAWNSVVTSNQKLDPVTDQVLENIYEAPVNQWDAGKGFELVMTQKWVDLMLDPLEAYSEWRRTGFPKLEETFTATGGVMSIPRRYVYPLGESIDNADHYQDAVSRLSAGDSPQSRVWWDE
ncbi:MAG: SusD/RagB family nutrient-binding outer membrane lipoprotein [Phaeodactylibacter sp.]|nr:SusD/RagB family nutrient-binding outer membrane lipoprotein [Phaeodactylibacter sp.]